MTVPATTTGAAAVSAGRPRFTGSRIEADGSLLVLNPDLARTELTDDEIRDLDLLYRTGRLPVVRDLTWREMMQAATSWSRVLYGSVGVLVAGIATRSVFGPEAGSYGLLLAGLGAVFGAMSGMAIGNMEPPARHAIDAATGGLRCREWSKAIIAAANVDRKVGAPPELDALLAELHPVCVRLQQLRNAAWDAYRIESATTPEWKRLEREAGLLAGKVQDLCFEVLASGDEPHRWQQTSEALVNPADLR